MMGRNKWGAVVLMVVLAACAKAENDGDAAADSAAATPPAAAEPEPAPAANLPAGVTQEMVTAGQQVFSAAGNCFTCHGADAKGTALAPNLTDAEWLNVDGTYQSIVDVVHSGVATPKKHPAPMPAMGGAALSNDQVNQVAAYVWSLGGGK